MEHRSKRDRKVNFTSPLVPSGLYKWSTSKVLHRAILPTLAPSACLHYSGSPNQTPLSLVISARPHLPNPNLHRLAASLVVPLHNLSSLRDRRPVFLAPPVLHSLKCNPLSSPILEVIRSPTFSARHNHNRPLACSEALRTMLLQRNLLTSLSLALNHSRSNKTIIWNKYPKDNSSSR